MEALGRRDRDAQSFGDDRLRPDRWNDRVSSHKALSDSGSIPQHGVARFCVGIGAPSEFSRRRGGRQDLARTGRDLYAGRGVVGAAGGNRPVVPLHGGRYGDLGTGQTHGGSCCADGERHCVGGTDDWARPACFDWSQAREGAGNHRVGCAGAESAGSGSGQGGCGHGQCRHPRGNSARAPQECG